MTQHWHVIIDADGHSGAENMAVDLALLDDADRDGSSALRLYRWDPPCLSFGRNESAIGHYDRAKIERLGIDVVRRPTGGSAVWHEHEVTYAVAAPIDTFGSMREAYCAIHEKIAAALRSLGADATLAPTRPPARPPTRPNSCFDAAVGGEVLVNGRKAKSVELPEPGRLVTPITVNLDQFVHSGDNRIEIKRAVGSSPASVQAVATYYLPWAESIATQNENWRANGSSGLRLVTRFDKTEGNVSDQINCHVEAERIGSRGYGMMLAEIGLPPGADVDRASLDSAMKGSDWSISQYDILPDRVIVYLWPRAGGTKFDFKFRPRFGLRAQTAASTVCDYYNPEARAIVAPIRFVVK